MRTIQRIIQDSTLAPGSQEGDYCVLALLNLHVNDSSVLMIVQMDAALYKALLPACQNGHVPGLPELLAKKLRYHLSNHLMIGDKLFFHKMSNNLEQMLEVPKRSDVPTILVVFHGSWFVGHLKVKRILQRLQESYHWTGMTKDIT